MDQFILQDGVHEVSRSAQPFANPTIFCVRNLWNHKEARFNSCFHPVLTAFPALISAAIVIFFLIRQLLPRRPQWTKPFVKEYVEPSISDEVIPRRRWLASTLALAIVSSLGFTVQLANAILHWKSPQTWLPAASWLSTLGLVLVFRPRTASISVLAVHMLQAITLGIVLGETYGSRMIFEQALDVTALCMSILGCCIIFAMPLRDPNKPAKEISQPFTEPTSSLRSPEDNLRLWHFMTVSWMTPLIRIGYNRQIEEEDVWQLAYEFHHQKLHDNFRLLKGTVIQRLVRANIIDIVILVILAVVELIFEYSGPMLLQKILASMEDPTGPRRATLVYAAISLSSRLLGAQSAIFSLWYGRRCYERSRGEMITMLYEKTLGRKISFAPDPTSEEDKSNGAVNDDSDNSESSGSQGQSTWSRLWRRMQLAFRKSDQGAPIKKSASMGKILNLMRNDVYEVAQRFWEIQTLVQRPLSVVFATTLVVNLLGWSSLLAIVVLIVANLVNFGLARVLIYFERKRRLATDDKLQIISQFIEAIRHLRWYGWQGAWLEKVMTARQKELKFRVVTSLWNVLINFNNALSLEMSPLVAFYAYTVLSGQPLRVDLAFPALELLSLLTDSLRELPQLIIIILNAWVAVGRIEEFMAEPDKQEMNTEALQGNEMALKHASFAWPSTSKTVLETINLSFPPGLTVISGEVAAGKSALLQALLGELDMLDGQLIRPNEPVAYCAQTPWLQIMSIRENILFGVPMDEKRYKAVIEACALTSDLAEFKAGDLTLIGENGIGLSGGQRARVALARALYSRARLMLLDDPLSALDQQTAESVASKCFNGRLAEGRTIVLVTHRTDLVTNFARQMIKIENGRAFELDMNSEAHLSLLRTISTISKDGSRQDKLTARDEAAAPEKFVEDEHRAHGGVQFAVYWKYIKAGKIPLWILLAVLLLSWRLLFITYTWFLKSWAEASDKRSTRAWTADYSFDMLNVGWDPTHGFPDPSENIHPWILGIFIITIALCTVYVIGQSIMVLIIYVAGKNMFIAVVKKVSGATFRFYDVTPIGRLMNRMTSDITVLDGNISQRFQSITSVGISWITSLFVIGTVTPAFLVFALLLAATYAAIFFRFLPASQSLRRLEMVSLTPLISNFGTLLNGLSTVRAFHAQRQFQNRVVRVVDTFQKMDHFYWSLQAWLMYRYDTLSGLATFLVTVIAVSTNVSAGLTAFVLISAERFVHSTHRLCKQYGQLQMEFVSVERVVELLDIEQEHVGDIHPPAWWPSFSGDIVFNNVTVRYAPHLDPALSDISFTIKGGSKTAVIGRTGSGKSTLALAMLATVLPEAGQILVDNVDLSQVDKQLLRTRVTFLAQDPVLFPGTMRENLDPINEHSDDECDLILGRVCQRQGWTLDTKIESGGQNLSQGQRQLVGLARAVLRRSAIIILDEATASIDRETAEQIQQIMYEEMKESTVVTIAHRLEAVRNADCCIVLGKGRILQQGPASEMLARYKAEMVDDIEEEI